MRSCRSVTPWGSSALSGAGLSRRSSFKTTGALPTKASERETRRLFMAIKMIHHVNVQISDRERTRAWYEQVLGAEFLDRGPALNKRQLDRKSTRLNSSHSQISYAVFCLK